MLPKHCRITFNPFSIYFAAKAPKTRLNLLAIRSQDGIDQLNHILRTRIPTLGATDFQPYQSIMELKVEDNMLLITFIKQAKDLVEALSSESNRLSAVNADLSHRVQLVIDSLKIRLNDLEEIR